MPALRANLPLNLKMLPHLADALPNYAKAVGLTASGVLSVLVWNDSVRPNRTLTALPRERRLKRASITCSLRTPQRKLARTRARTQRMSLNAYLEALLAIHLARPRSASLTILNAAAT